jgi:hypothetical protein
MHVRPVSQRLLFRDWRCCNPSSDVGIARIMGDPGDGRLEAQADIRLYIVQGTVETSASRSLGHGILERGRFHTVCPSNLDLGHIRNPSEVIRLDALEIDIGLPQNTMIQLLHDDPAAADEQ